MQLYQVEQNEWLVLFIFRAENVGGMMPCEFQITGYYVDTPRATRRN